MRKIYPALLALTLAGAPTVSGAPEPTPTPEVRRAAAHQVELDGVVRYRASVGQRQLDDWMRFGAPSSEDRRREAESLAMLLTLSEEALDLGLDQRPQVRNQLAAVEAQVARSILRRRLQEEVEVSESDLDTLVAVSEDTIGLPRRIRLRNLLLRFPPDATEADRRRLRTEVEALRRRALAGESFEALAKVYSQSSTRYVGGLMGNVRPGALSPDLEAVVGALEVGGVSEVLENAKGLTVLYCEAILPAVVRSPAEKRKISRDTLIRRTFRRNWGRLEEAVLEAASPTFAWDVLDAGDPRATLVTFLGGELTVGEVGALIGARGESPEVAAVGAPRERLVNAVEAAVLGRGLVRELWLRGWGRLPEFVRAVDFKRRQALAGAAVAERVQGRLAAPTEAEMAAHFKDHGEN
ncbi:MAG: peptidylprolyl isomerase, partial [Acidobacteriota bacterium]